MSVSAPDDRMITPRLTLVPATAEIVRADLSDRPALVGLLGAVVPENWPPEILVEALPELLARLEEGWGQLGWYWLLHADSGGLPGLIGGGGFNNDPRHCDEVEIGYAVLPQYRDCGFATEAVAAMVRWAFSHGTLEAVSAETLAGQAASIRVLEKNGFQLLGEGSEPGTVEYLLLREDLPEPPGESEVKN
jgi:ribosomal-protein-alanine N-acetyltransferase